MKGWFLRACSRRLEGILCGACARDWKGQVFLRKEVVPEDPWMKEKEIHSGERWLHSDCQKRPKPSIAKLNIPPQLAFGFYRTLFSLMQQTSLFMSAPISVSYSVEKHRR